MTDQDYLDRDDLASLEKWLGAEFRVIETRLDGMGKALEVAASEADKKNAELNDVRHRFISREVFESYVRQHADAFEAYRTEMARRARASMIAIGTMGLAIVGLVLEVLG